MYPNQMNPQQQQGGFGFDVNQYEAQAPIENLPIGWYNVLITEAEMEQLQSGNGTCCKNVYTVFGGPFDGRKLFDNLNIIHSNERAQDIARRQLRTIQDSIGKPVQGPWDLINNYMCVKVGLSKPKKDASPDEKAAHEARNEVKGYKPFDAALHAQNQQPAPQQYNVSVQPGVPMGNVPQQSMPQQFAQQSMQPQVPQHAPQQAPAPQYQAPAPQLQQAPMQQMPPQQPMPQQPQQNYAPQPGNVPGSQQEPIPGQQVQAPNVPDATGQAGQPSQPPAAPNAQQQVAPQQTFAPQPGQQQAPQNIPNPPQPQQQQVAPNPQYAPQQQQGQMPQPPQPQQQSGNVPPPPGSAW